MRNLILIILIVIKKIIESFYDRNFKKGQEEIEWTPIGKLIKNLKEKGILKLFDYLKEKKGKININQLKAELNEIIN